MQNKKTITFLIIIAVLNALTDYDLFVIEQIMSKTLTKSVLASAFGQGSRYLDAYCKEIKTCTSTTVMDSLTKILKRIILFQRYKIQSICTLESNTCMKCAHFSGTVDYLSCHIHKSYINQLIDY